MYTNVYSVILFSITESSTGPASSDLKKHSVPSLSPVAFSAVSVHLFPSVLSSAAVCVNQHGLREVPLILSYVTYSTCRDACNENTSSELHVIIQ